MLSNTIRQLESQCPRHLNLTSTDPVSKQDAFLSAPFNESCVEAIFERMNDQLKKYALWEEVIYTSAYVLISLLAVIGNGIVVMAVVRKREMRTDPNILIANLAVANLLLAITIVPFLCFFCKFANALPGSNIYCSTLTISTMAIDRYYTVRRMNVAGVSNKQTKCFNAVGVSIGIWTLSFLLSLPLLIYYDIDVLYVFKGVPIRTEGGEVETKSYGWSQCRIAPSGQEEDTLVDEESIQFLVSIMQILFLYVTPLAVLATFNWRLNLFLKARMMERNKSVKSRGVVDLPLSEPTENGEVVKESGVRVEKEATSPTSLHPRRHSGEFIANAIARARRASIHHWRRNRTTLLLMAMASAYAILWFPFTLVSMLIDFGIVDMEAHSRIIDRVDQYCKFISILSICVNPFLYGFLNTNFHNEFAEIFEWVTGRLKRICPCSSLRQTEEGEVVATHL